mgnify:CR=1 FL=1
MKNESKWQKVGAFLAAVWGIGSFLFILLGFIVALAYLVKTAPPRSLWIGLIGVPGGVMLVLAGF